jgi:hypothetical protein
MLTLRLPSDDRAGGLAEQPAVFKPSNASSLTSTALAGHGASSMRTQLKAASRHGAIVERIAVRFGLLPSIIAGFCSRRSGWGLDLDPAGVDGTRDFQARASGKGSTLLRLPEDGLGFVRGLMGLDIDRHATASDLQWRDPECNLRAAFEIVLTHQRTLRRRTTLQGAGLLRASMAAFECGLAPVERAIRAGLDVDSPTIGFDRLGQGCGSDVLARAVFFQAEGWD